MTSPTVTRQTIVGTVGIHAVDPDRGVNAWVGNHGAVWVHLGPLGTGVSIHAPYDLNQADGLDNLEAVGAAIVASVRELRDRLAEEAA